MGDGGIAAGVEVTIDYKRVDICPGNVNMCLCGSDECRHILSRGTGPGFSSPRASQRLPPEQIQAHRMSNRRDHLQNPYHRRGRHATRRLSSPDETKTRGLAINTKRGVRAGTSTIGQKQHAVVSGQAKLVKRLLTLLPWLFGGKTSDSP